MQQCSFVALWVSSLYTSARIASAFANPGAHDMQQLWAAAKTRDLASIAFMADKAHVQDHHPHMHPGCLGALRCAPNAGSCQISESARRTYDHAVRTMIAGTCAAIPGAKGTGQWVQQGLQVVALVWYFVPRFKLTERGVQAFGLGHRQMPHSDNVRRSWKTKAE